MFDALHSAKIVWKLPTGKDVIEVSSILDESDNVIEHEYFIVALPRGLKITVTCLVTGVRIVTAMFLAWSGARYLILSNDMAHVLLKAVGLQFVLKLDELLFQSFGPAIFKRQLEHTRFRYESTPLSLWRQSPFPFDTCVVPNQTRKNQPGNMLCAALMLEAAVSRHE